jgi:exodeoxyribonuclease-3
VVGNPLHPDPQKRLLAATVGDLCVVCAYVPNGQSVGSDKYAYKLEWLDGLATGSADRLTDNPKLVLAGDFNIAPEDRTSTILLAWAGQILCSTPERQLSRVC